MGEMGLDSRFCACVKADVIKEKAMAVVSDVGERPLYDGKIVGYGLGAIVVLAVLRAIVTGVDSIAILPSALEVVSLGYTTWLFWRYTKESSRNLGKSSLKR